MDPGALDVLEDPRDQDVVAVERRIDLDLFPAHVLVDQQRRARRDRRRALDVARELPLVVDDLHPAPAEHVRRADEHRKTDLARDRARFAERVRRAAARPRDAELLERRVELLAVFRHVERTAVAADDRDPARGELGGEIDRRLAAEGEHHPARAASRARSPRPRRRPAARRRARRSRRSRSTPSRDCC